jgi:hypothetical protein
MYRSLTLGFKVKPYESPGGGGAWWFAVGSGRRCCEPWGQTRLWLKLARSESRANRTKSGSKVVRGTGGVYQAFRYHRGAARKSCGAAAVHESFTPEGPARNQEGADGAALALEELNRDKQH